MAIGALIPLILGGGFALQERKRKRTEGERANLARGFQSAIGQQEQPGLFNDQQAPVFASDGSITGGAGAQRSTGLLGNVSDPGLQQQMIAAGNIFGLKGGEQLGASMLQNAISGQQTLNRDQTLFNQQEQSQQRGFDQSDQQQQAGFANTNENARLQREQSAANNQAAIDERRAVRSDEIQRKADAFSLQNSAAGTPAGDKVRVPLPEGGWTDVPKFGSTEYVQAAGKVDGLQAQVERMDSMMKLFDEVGTNAFGKEGGELESRYTEAVLGMKNVYELGVLSESDEQLLRSVMQDPNGFNALTTGDKTIKAGYQNAMETLQRTLRTENQKYNLWGIGSELDKTTPSQIEELAESKRQSEAAIAGGMSGGDIEPGRAPSKKKKRRGRGG